jgi:transglutaminase-like putative cysteine protease
MTHQDDPARRGRRDSAQTVSGRLPARNIRARVELFVRLGLAAIATLGVASMLSGATQPDALPANRAWSSFGFSYVVRVSPPASTHSVHVTIPLPSSDDDQTISELQLAAPVKVRVRKGKDGDQYAEVDVESSPTPSSFEVRVSFHVLRYERRFDLAAAIDPPGAFPKDVVPFLQPDKSVSGDETVAGISREQTQGLASPLDKARNIYEYVISTMRTDREAAGGCRSGVPGAAQQHAGNCAEFDSLFVALAQAAGIPARLQVGFLLPTGQYEGTVSGDHGWAEFYANGVGWVPVDISQASQDPSKRGDFFGAIDARRVVISMGRGLTDAHGRNSETSNSVAFPFVEMDGKPSAHYSVDLFFDQAKITSSRFVVVRKPIFAGGSWAVDSRSPRFPSQSVVLS